MITMDTFRKFCFWVCCFFAPLGIQCAVSVLAGVYPFGVESFLTEDEKFQYVDFYLWMRQVLMGKGSLFYTDALSMGQNAWGIFSYYLTNPLMLFLPFIQEGSIGNFVFFSVAIKLGAMQCLMVLFLLRRFHIRPLPAFVLALCFTWSSWVATQLRNPMWLDVVAFLPLVAYGIFSFVCLKRWKTLLFSLAASILCCWYLSYMVVAFGLFYFALEWYLAASGDVLSSKRELFEDPIYGIDRGATFRTDFSMRSFWAWLLRYVGICLVSLAISAVTFVPTLLSFADSRDTTQFQDHLPGLSRGESFVSDHAAFILGCAIAFIAVILFIILIARSRKIPIIAKRILFVCMFVFALIGVFLLGQLSGGVLVMCDIATLVKGFVPGTYVEWLFSPQCSTSILILALLVAFFAGRRISIHAKLALFGMLAFLVISAWFKPLYMIWCGFRSPSGFYCRMAFLFAFMCVWGAAYAVRIYLGARQSRQENGKEDIPRIYGIPEFCLWSVMGISVACELIVSACLSWSQLYVGYPESYSREYIEEANQLVEDIDVLVDQPYRMDMVVPRAGLPARNGGMSAGYMSLSSYTSSKDASGVALINSLGYSQKGELSVSYVRPMIASDALLGVAYVCDYACPDGFVDTGLQLPVAGQGLFENPYALSLGYIASDEIVDLTFEGLYNPFERQNAMMSALVGEEVSPYKSCEIVASAQGEGLPESMIVAKAEEGQLADGEQSEGMGQVADGEQLAADEQEAMDDQTIGDKQDIDPDGLADSEISDTCMQIRVNVPAGCIGYVYGEPSQEAQYFVSSDTGLSDSMLGGEWEDGVCAFTRITAEPTASTITFYGIPDGVDVTPYIYFLDMAEFETVRSKLAEGQMSFRAYEDGYILGTVDADAQAAKDGMLLLTTPATPGWSAKVNGQPVEIQEVLDGALVALPISEGQNVIEMRFVSPGFAPGVTISGIAIIAVALACLFPRRKDAKPTLSAKPDTGD